MLRRLASSSPLHACSQGAGGRPAKARPSCGSRATAAPRSSCRRRFRPGSPRWGAAGRPTSRRYGGRFVQAIDGIEGDIAEQHDWFYFVNGYEADISAADYELHDGDVLWWDNRSWEGRCSRRWWAPFPEPFLHGWGGKKRPAVVRGPRGEGLEGIAELVGADVNEALEGANELVLVPGSGFRARLEGLPGDPVVFELGLRDAERLLDDLLAGALPVRGLP